ncbi:MAG: GNAT family N-acetyltransferase [Bryobacteraceae bacterium]
MLPFVELWKPGGHGPAPPIPPLPAAQLRREITNLPAGQTLFRQGPFDVVLARAYQIPALMLEIARVREIAFRLAGEGTGKSYDLDRFDEHYEHLVLWDREQCEVAGAYRLITTGNAMARHGRGGLYTASLFHLSGEFFKALGPAVELGRSFVHPAYQRKPHSLLLLWRGIGCYLEFHRECRARAPYGHAGRNA